MFKTLCYLLALTIALCAGLIAFIFYSLNSDQRGFFVDTFMYRLESFVANPPAFPELADKIGRYLDLNIGSCKYVSAPSAEGLISSVYSGKEDKFPFSATISLIDTGVLCEFAGHGSPFLVQPAPFAHVEIIRTLGKPPRFQFPPVNFTLNGIFPEPAWSLNLLAR